MPYCRIPCLITVSALGCTLWILGALPGNQSPLRAQNAEGTRLPAATQVEEIYIARSVPESRTAPTAFCAQERSGFSGARVEGQYMFRSIATQTSDGRMIDTNVKTIGSIHLCLGSTSDAAISNLYGDILLGHTSFRGMGECHRQKADFPEKGLNVLSCFLNLSGLPSPYIGGLLTTNSMTSLKSIGMETDPSGYTQTSIATIRLWKKRVEQ
jgi:hypothetical protein